jgi:hypothetical protein
MVESLKDLERLLKLCRKQGVTEITVVGATLKLGEAPTKHSGESIEDQDDQSETVFDEPLSAEELIAFSNGAN